LKAFVMPVAGVLVVMMAGWAGYWCGRHPIPIDFRSVIVWADRFFEIKTIEISGGGRVSKEEILALVHRLGGRGLMTVDTAKVQRILERRPWIQQARIHRVFPDMLAVEVKEREPAAVLRAGGRDLLIGEDGALIVDANPGTFEGFPVLTGLGYAEVLSRTHEATERLLAGIALANLLSETGVDRMEVDIGAVRDLVAYHNGYRVRFGDSAFGEKVERYRRLVEGMSAAPKLREVEVDLRFRDRVIVRERGGKRRWAEKTKSL
jgi:cell division protein FtsQ